MFRNNKIINFLESRFAVFLFIYLPVISLQNANNAVYLMIFVSRFSPLGLDCILAGGAKLMTIKRQNNRLYFEVFFGGKFEFPFPAWLFERSRTTRGKNCQKLWKGGKWSFLFLTVHWPVPSSPEINSIVIIRFF